MNKRFQTGETIGGYRILGFLGEGGMGEVYHGVHEKLGRLAAIKVLGETALKTKMYRLKFPAGKRFTLFR